MKHGERVLLQAELLKTEEKNSSYYLYLRKIRCIGKTDSAGYRYVLLTVKKGTVVNRPLDEGRETSAAILQIEDLRPGNRLSAEASCEGFQSARNRGNFDEASYYHSLGVEEKFRLTGDLLLTSERIHPLRAVLSWMRARLKESVMSLTSETDTPLEAEYHAGIFLAILTGDKSSLDTDTKELYRKSGIAHILAISGLHISFIGMSLFSFLRKRMRFSVAACVSGMVMIFFCIMSGESASAVRATIMFLTMLLALKFGKTFDLLSALGLAAILLLLSNPMYLYNIGFLLSFGAVLGIGICSAFHQQKPSEDRRKDWKQKLKEKTTAAFLSSFSITVFTLPVIVNSYYEIPVVSILLHLVVVPLMAYVLGSGVFGTLLGLFSLFLGRMLIGAGVYLISMIEFLCVLIDRIPFSTVITGHLSGIRIVLYYLGILAFVFLAKKAESNGRKKKDEKRYRRFIKTAAVIVLALQCLLLFFHPSKGLLQLSFFDVDQGDGILIESPSGKVYMIDGGSSSVSALYRYRIESALKYKGIRKIDYVMISHTDTDHISAVMEMLSESGAGSIEIGHLAVPYIPENAHYDELVAAAENKGVTILTHHKGMTISDGALRFSCLYPENGYRASDANNYSAVMSLSYGVFDAVFTGDIGAEGEKILLDDGMLKDYDLLKVAHHGSKYSSGRAFLKAIMPETAIISAGVHNSYGHPHPETIQRLTDAGAECFVTADVGEIEVSADKEGNFKVSTLLV